MPILCPVEFLPITKDQFHALDHKVMRHAFDCHNDLGRECDEVIYRRDLAQRLKEAGFRSVRTLEPIEVTWKSFRKVYYTDLVVEDAAIYELKTLEHLGGRPYAQTLNYLLLTGTQEGKVVNFRPPSVEWEYVSTRLTPDIRRDISFCENRFRACTPNCHIMQSLLKDLLWDWGAFLELALYERALVWFLGGERSVYRQVQLQRNGLQLGHQLLPCLAPDVLLRLTASTRNLPAMETHLRRFLNLTPCRALQWVNFQHGHIEFTTLEKVAHQL